jgi:hypothetical protein
MPSTKRAASRSAAESGGPVGRLSTTRFTVHGKSRSHVWSPDTCVGQSGSLAPVCRTLPTAGSSSWSSTSETVVDSHTWVSPAVQRVEPALVKVIVSPSSS